MSITAANAIFLISCPLFLPTSQQLQGFSADDIYLTDEVTTAETMMGVDGYLSGGAVFNPVSQAINLMADSASVDFFEQIDAAQQASVRIGGPGVFPMIANITLTDVGKSYQLNNGILVKMKRLPDAKKLLQPRTFHVMWESVIAIPIGVFG